MELVAYLVASIIISNYLEKKSKVGNVAFSILFTVLLGFYLVVSPSFRSILPEGIYFTEGLVVFREALDETFGLVSAVRVINFSMLLVVASAALYGAYVFLGMLGRLFVRCISRALIKPYVTGELVRPSSIGSSSVVALPAPIAQTRTYIKLGVLRN